MQKNYKIIFWDFDGVILDSMAIRDLGFLKVLESEGYDQTLINQLLEYHRANGGLSRYVKFKYFFDNILNRPVTKDEISRLANLFSSIMLNLLIDPTLLIDDSYSFIKQNYENFKFHIVSGSDGIELKEICRGLGIDRYFLSIDGSPTPKNELVAKLIQEYSYSVSDICLIGDSINDYQAAKVNSIDFYGYNNKNLDLVGQGYISSFK